jgi:hypothetical protein
MPLKRAVLLLVAASLALGCRARPVPAPAVMAASPYGQKLELRQKADGSSAVVVSRLGSPTVDQLRNLCEKGDKPWTDYLLVRMKGNRTLKEGETTPPILGTCQVVGDELHFTPRFPLAKGATIEAFFSSDGNLTSVLESTRLVGFAYNLTTESFHIPKPATLEDPRIVAVYPSANTLPENQLKFYIHFSAPMSRGQAYECVHLFETGGKEVDKPFLELGEELWDPSGTRFTLFIDPGRIKRELQPRQLFGPALMEGKSYTLVVEAKWRDADGNPLKDSFRKNFKVGPTDEQQPDVKTWTIQPPPAGSKEAVVVSSPEPLDRGLLERVLSITDGGSKPVAGKVEIADLERRWQFTPEQPWQAGEYQLVAETILEDLAGNNLSRPFEVDLLRPIQRQITTDTVKLPFEVK